jgi:hypothetical protein
MPAVAGVRGPIESQLRVRTTFDESLELPFDDKFYQARSKHGPCTPWPTRCVYVSQVTDTWPMHSCMHASSAQRAHHATARARAPSTSAAQGRPSDTLLDDRCSGQAPRPKQLGRACMHAKTPSSPPDVWKSSSTSLSGLNLPQRTLLARLQHDI